MANSGITDGQALYLYGISKSPGGKPPKIASAGIDGVHPVQPVSCGDFLCWISAVDRNEFADAINRNLENLEWLALHGVRHQQAVSEIAAKGVMIPARFGTIFSTEQALVKDVQARKAALQKVFSRISDADEWGVKIFAEQSAPPKASVARSGKEYLQQKAARLKRPEHDDAGIQEFATELAKIASDSAPTGKVSGAQPNLLWQSTFLVPRSQRRQWDAALKNFVKKWSGSRRIEVNGPWPPYSFVSDAE